MKIKTGQMRPDNVTTVFPNEKEISLNAVKDAEKIINM